MSVEPVGIVLAVVGATAICGWWRARRDANAWRAMSNDWHETSDKWQRIAEDTQTIALDLARLNQQLSAKLERSIDQ